MSSAISSAASPGSPRQVADYWTVVLEMDVEDVAEFERHMAASRQEVTGYMDLADGVRRKV